MLSEVEFQDHKFVTVCPYVFVSGKNEKRRRKLPILIILIYCNLLRSYTLACMNGRVGEDYVTQQLAGLTYPNYKYFPLTVNLTAINTRTKQLLHIQCVKYVVVTSLITLCLVRHCVAVCPRSHDLTRSLHFPC